MTTAPIVLEMQNVAIRFSDDGPPALDDFSLTLRRGQIVGLIGESGSGKSLAGFATARLEPPAARLSAGKLTVGGVDLLKAPKTQLGAVRGRIIAHIFQEPMAAFSPTRKLGRQMADVLSAHQTGLDLKTALRQATDLLADVGIDAPSSAIEKYPFELSGGMLQRALIALAFAGAPQLVVADEITTAIDASTRQTVMDLVVKRAADVGAAVLFISHDLDAVRAVAPDVMVLYRGRVLESGPTQGIIETPFHPYTEMLLSSIPGRSVPGTPLPTSPEPSRDLPAEGCNFRDRCPLAEEKCASPQLLEKPEPGRSVRCWKRS